MKKRWISLLLTLCLLVGILPVGAIAADNEVTVDGMTFAVYEDHAVLKECQVRDVSELVIPDTVEGVPVTVIGSGALSGERGISRIVVPEGVTTLGNWAFSHSDAREIQLPDSLTTLGMYEFTAMKNLESIQLPNGIQYLDYETFKDCASLREVQLPKGMFAITGHAFAGCTALEEIVLPEGMTGIDGEAFLNCTSLRKVTFPKALESLHPSIFEGCTALAEFVGSATASGIKVINGMVISADRTEVLCYPRASTAKTVTVPAGVEKVGYKAFSNCVNIESVKLPATVTELEVLAFCSCTSLKRFDVPEGATEVPDMAFSGCTALTEVTLPETVATLGWDAFKGCPIQRIVIPASVTEMSACGLAGDDLVIVGYQDSPAHKYAQRNDIQFESLGTLPGKSPDMPQELLQYEIQGDHVVITGADFASDSYYRNIIIPEEIDGYPVTEIGSSAFFWTDGLESVTVPDSVTKIGDHAFASCYDLREVELPAYLTELSDSIFQSCWNLQMVNLPEELTTIGGGAFGGCKSIGSVVLPETVTEIGPYAFENCTLLEKIYLPEGLTTIGDCAFSGCVTLKELYVPSTVTAMGGYSFGYDFQYKPYGDCTLYTYASSDAVRYARENQIELYIYSFDDDDENGVWTWASDSIYNCVGAGLINGYPGNLFCPEQNISRIELVMMMYRLYREMDIDIGEVEEHPFVDAKGDWYQAALNWAYTTGIVNGKTDTQFEPDAPIQRQELAAILYRFITTFFETDPVTTNQIQKFADAGTVEPYARTAMEFCIANGIINGVSERELAPRETATRAQAACVLDRAFIE